jgi:hypothetical protein
MSVRHQLSRAGTVLLTLAVCWIPAAPARGDADPASDILLGSPAFFPYQPPVPPSLQNQLINELGQLRQKGLNLKVAIIERPLDLGAIPNMFGHPQAYAQFLDREISFNQAQPLLVAMPDGFGLSHAGSADALSGLRPAASQGSEGLTRSAIVAVERIAHAEGKPVTAGRPVSGGGSGGGASPLLTFGGPAILVILGALVAARLQRRRAGRTPEG